MSRFQKIFIALFLTAVLGLGSLTVGGVDYSAYNMGKLAGDWREKYNNFVTAVQSSINTLTSQVSALAAQVLGFVTAEDQLVYITATPTYVDGDTFTVPGDFTAKLAAGKVVLLDLGADGVKFNTVASSSFDPAGGTTCNLNTANLTANLARVAVFATRDGLWPWGDGRIFGRDYGSPGQAALQAAFDFTGPLEREIALYPGTWTISSNLAKPDSITLGIPRGAKLHLVNATITLGGLEAVRAGDYQIISWEGTGKADWTSPQNPRAVWWGVVADGVADDTAAAQKAIDAIPDGYRNTVLFPAHRTLYLTAGLTNGPGQARYVSLKGDDTTLKMGTAATTSIAARNHLSEISGFKFTNAPGLAKSNVAALDVLHSVYVGLRDLNFDNLKSGGLHLRGDCQEIDGENLRATKAAADFIKLSANGGFYPQKVRLRRLRAESPSDPYGPGDLQIRAVHIEHGYDVTLEDITFWGTAAWSAELGFYQGWRDAIHVGHNGNTDRPDKIYIRHGSITGMGDDCIGYSGVGELYVFDVEGFGSLKTGGIFCPSDGTLINDKVTVDYSYFHDSPYGMVFKDTKEVFVNGARIKDVDNEGIWHLNAGSGVLELLQCTSNTIKNCGKTGIKWSQGRAIVMGNDINGFGSAGGGILVDKSGIAAGDAMSNSVIAKNGIHNGPNAITYSGSPTRFYVGGNVGSGITEYGHNFAFGFAGDYYILGANILSGAAGNMVGNPAPSATKVYTDNM